MTGGLAIVAFTFAALSGVCFVTGIKLLAKDR